MSDEVSRTQRHKELFSESKLIYKQEYDTYYRKWQYATKYWSSVKSTLFESDSDQISSQSGVHLNLKRSEIDMSGEKLKIKSIFKNMRWEAPECTHLTLYVIKELSGFHIICRKHISEFQGKHLSDFSRTKQYYERFCFFLGQIEFNLYEVERYSSFVSKLTLETSEEIENELSELSEYYHLVFNISKNLKRKIDELNQNENIKQLMFILTDLQKIESYAEMYKDKAQYILPQNDVETLFLNSEKNSDKIARLESRKLA